MKCQRQLLQISWQQFIRNDEVAATNGLPSISEVIRRRCSALFGHVARLPQDVPAHKALSCHIDLSLGRPPNEQWKRRPGLPRQRWIDQVRKDKGILVWCVMSEKCLKLKVFAKIDFIVFFGFLRGQISLKYWGLIFPAPQPYFMTSFSKWPPLG